MSFAVIRATIGAYGETISREAVKIDLPTQIEADRSAEEFAKSQKEHGFNEQHGYWWHRDDEGRLCRFTVE